MNDNERKLSDYIDRLNEEKKPKEHDNSSDSPELDELFHTVRLVRGLKEPALPGADYQKKLAHSTSNKILRKNPTKNRKRIWFTGVASIAAVVFLSFMMNYMLPFSQTNIVNAMEEAYQEVEAYHGVIEIASINASGKSTTQGKLEIWANKAGHYYMKGLEGSQKDIITVNNGQQKWQVRPTQKQVHILPAFPDAYRFTFELGKEIDDVKNALSTKVIGEEVIAGRQASILEVSPQGGVPYQIWIDKETMLPLQKKSGMQNALQYKITYSQLEFRNIIPEELTAYHLPNGFEEINTNPEQLVNDLNEAKEVVGFAPKVPEKIPTGYVQDSIAIVPNLKLVKLYYTSPDKKERVIVIQGKSVSEFKPVSNAVLGKINHSVAEIQSPVYEDLGILGGGGLYSGATDISSIRWQQDGFEYAVVGNASLEELISFTESLTNGTFEMPSLDDQDSTKPQVEVPVDLETEENDQKSVDAGSSPWKLDPTFVTQVFVSLEISPEGITGEYPIHSEDLKLIQNTGKDAIVEISGGITPIKRIYLKRLIREDSTGIWTVVGYDPIDKK